MDLLTLTYDSIIAGGVLFLSYVLCMELIAVLMPSASTQTKNARRAQEGIYQIGAKPDNNVAYLSTMPVWATTRVTELKRRSS